MEIGASVPLFQDFDRATGLEELAGHEYLDDLGGAFRARFGDGTEAIANPSNKAYEFEEGTLDPETIVLKFSDGRRQRATARRDWIVTKG